MNLWAGVVLIFFLFLLIISILWFSLYTGITPMPTGYKVKKSFFKIVPPFFNEMRGGKILELGAGFGTLAIPLAIRFPSREIIAYELSIVPYCILKFFQKALFLKNLKVERKDFFKASFSEAACAICYLYPAAMEKLKDKFKKELPEEALIISHTFAIADWKPIATYQVEDLYRSKIYVYQNKKL